MSPEPAIVAFNVSRGLMVQLPDPEIFTSAVRISVFWAFRLPDPDMVAESSPAIALGLFQERAEVWESAENGTGFSVRQSGWESQHEYFFFFVYFYQ